MTTQTQLRRGTNAQVLAMTPASNEAVVDTTNTRLNLGDGATAGGIPIPNSIDIQKQTFIYSTVGGTANAITLTNSNKPVQTYTNGLRLSFKASSTNTGAATVDIDGQGAKNIYKLSGTSLVALSGNELVSGAIYDIIYDGTQFQITNTAGNGGVSNKQTFTTSGTWTKPSGYATTAMVLLQGWGGGGGGSASGGNGTNGGQTTIGSLLTALGGSGGSSSGAGGAGGGILNTATSGSRTNDGNLEGSGSSSSTIGTGGFFFGAGGGAGTTNINGLPSVYGGGGGAGGSGGTAGSSIYGGSGGNSGANAQSPAGGGGGNGSGYGGGGGGSYRFRWVQLADMGATETITIGAAGAGASGGAGNGGTGRVIITVFG